MLTTILLAFLLVVLLGAIGFTPSDNFSPAARGTIGTIILIAFVVYMLKYTPWLH